MGDSNDDHTENAAQATSKYSHLNWGYFSDSSHSSDPENHLATVIGNGRRKILKPVRKSKASKSSRRPTTASLSIPPACLCRWQYYSDGFRKLGQNIDGSFQDFMDLMWSDIEYVTNQTVNECSASRAALIGNKIWLMSWTEPKFFIYDPESNTVEEKDYRVFFPPSINGALRIRAAVQLKSQNVMVACSKNGLLLLDENGNYQQQVHFPIEKCLTFCDLTVEYGNTIYALCSTRQYYNNDYKNCGLILVFTDNCSNITYKGYMVIDDLPVDEFSTFIVHTGDGYVVSREKSQIYLFPIVYGPESYRRPVSTMAFDIEYVTEEGVRLCRDPVICAVDFDGNILIGCNEQEPFLVWNTDTYESDVLQGMFPKHLKPPITDAIFDKSKEIMWLIQPKECEEKLAKLKYQEVEIPE